MGVSIGRGEDGSCGNPSHRGVQQEAADNHIGEGGLLHRLCTVHGGGSDAGDNTVVAMVGSRHSK